MMVKAIFQWLASSSSRMARSQISRSQISLLSLGLISSLIPMAIAAPARSQAYNAPAYGNTLQAEDQGESVSALQQRLAELGYYSGAVTGYFDAETQAAVTEFQQSNGLAADGIVGTATTDALYQSGNQSGSPDQASRPAWNEDAYPTAAADEDAGGAASDESVLGLQQQLTQLGYYNGATTGVFDEATRSAVMAFQRDRGLAVDGIVGQQTTAALYQPAASPDAVTPDANAGYLPNQTPGDGLLQLGDAGTDVSNLQTQLQSLGYYNGPISGSFEEQTQAALIAFQQAHGLSADGIAGPQVSSTLSTVAASFGTPAATTATTTAVTTTVTTPTVTTITQPTVTQPASQLGSPTLGQPAGTTAIVPQTLPTQPGMPTTGFPGTVPSPGSTVQVPPLPPTATPTASQPAFPGSSALPPQQAPAGANSRFSVTELQRRLEMRGFNPGDMTGVYDAETQNAINQAQEAYGLSGSDLFGN